MEPSRQAWLVHNDDTLRQRIEAIVRADWWLNDGDVTRDVPVEPISWAVATNAAIAAAIATAVEQKRTEDPGISETQAVIEAASEVTESDLSYVVLSVALPRFGV